MNVDILMATYNGAQYIEEQIESILQQSHTDWRLLVRDDGSIDDTERIVKDYASKDSRIVWIDNEGESLGVAKNFIRLLDYSDAPFCLFCDQDDIWFPEKVKVMIDAISVRDQSIPQVAFSNAKLWNLESGALSGGNTFPYPMGLKDLFFRNIG